MTEIDEAEMKSRWTGWKGPTLDDVLATLALRAVGDGRFEADSIRMGHGRMYGGQVLAQMVVAAAETVPEKVVKSVHVQFARNGVAAEPATFVADVVHDGGSFSSVMLRVEQDGRTLAASTVLLHRPDDGPEQQHATLHHADPDTLPPGRMSMIPWDTRVVDGIDLMDRGVGPAEFAFWTRAEGLDAPPAVHQALVAWASDLTVIGTAMRALPDTSQLDSHRTLQTATTAHTVWFHHPLSLAEWACFQQTATVTADGRSFGWGQVFERGGRLVASYAQDAMVRTLKGEPRGPAATSA